MSRSLSLSLLRLGALSVAAAAWVSPAAAQTTLRLSTYVNEIDIRYQGFKKFAELAAAKTSGRVKVEIFPSSTLHGWSEGIDAVITISEMRDRSSGAAYGVEILDGVLAGLLARAVVVVDRAGKVVYTQQVPEIAQEPDYASALAAARAAN